MATFPQVHRGVIDVKRWYDDNAGTQPNGNNGKDGANCLETGPKTFNFYNSYETLNEYKQYGKEHLGKNIQVSSLNDFLKYLDTITGSITKVWKN